MATKSISATLALSLVEEVIKDKRARHISPDYALRVEVMEKVNQALDTLVADGSLIMHMASVNQIPAYEVPAHN